MPDYTLEEMQSRIFGATFFMANKLEVLGDRHLAFNGITIKQWLMCVFIRDAAHYPPSLSDVASEMATSRQNAKQIALKLAESGYIMIDKDPMDARVLRLSLTEKCVHFWEDRQESDNAYIGKLLNCFTPQEIRQFHDLISRFYLNLMKEYSETFPDQNHD